MARWDDVLPQAKRANSPFLHRLVLPTLKGLEGTPPALVRMHFTWSPIQMLCSLGNTLIGTPRNDVLPAMWAGFLDGSMIKNPPGNAGDAGDLGSIPWRRKSQSTPIFLPGTSHGQRGLVSYSPWGHKESDTTEHACSWNHFTVISAKKGKRWSKKNLTCWVARQNDWAHCIHRLSFFFLPNRLSFETQITIPLYRSGS